MKTEDKWERLFVAAWLFVFNRLRTPVKLQSRLPVHKIPYIMDKLVTGRIGPLKDYAQQLDEEINKSTR